MKRKILVPIDFSDCSINALENAILVAQKMKLGLYLLHTYLIPAPPVTIGGGTTYMGEIASDIEDNIRLKFEELKMKFPFLNEGDCQFSHIHNELNLAIEEIEEREAIQMVIMGTKGAKGIGQFIMGSNTYSVIKGSKLPVLIIPKNAGKACFERIAFLTNYEKIDNPRTFLPLLKIVMNYKSKVDIIYLGNRDKMTNKEIQGSKNIKVYFDQLRNTHNVSKDTEIEKAIEDYVLLHKIDLLVMIPKKHNFFEALFGKSLTKKMVFHSKTPLLVLPS